MTQELTEGTTHKGGNEWKETTKATVTKMFFPDIKDRLQTKFKMTPNFTAIVIGHGKTKAYLRRFKIINDSMCQCNAEEQTVDHIICECEMLKNQKQNIFSSAKKSGNWPPRKEDIIKKDLK